MAWYSNGETATMVEEVVMTMVAATVMPLIVVSNTVTMVWDGGGDNIDTGISSVDERKWQCVKVMEMVSWYYL
ncbi:hypothetical protein U1Q18_028305 [Sarracenia purpurea var. burkii]